MKIILVNKYYYRRRGGETSFFDMKNILERNGHEVIPFSMHHPNNEPTPWSRYFVSHIEYTRGGLLSLAFNGLKSLYSFEARSKFSKLIIDTRPDLVHIHNIYHQISPSILDVCRKAKIPVVQTIHDYKLICPNYKLFANGKIDESCKASLWHDVYNRSHKNSFIQSFAVVFESWVYRLFGTWKRGVMHWIAPSAFVKNKFIEFGMPADRITVVYHPYVGEMSDARLNCAEQNSGVAYVGAFSEEKGVETLLESMKQIDSILHLYGDGPLRAVLEKKALDEGVDSKVIFHGYLSKEQLLVEIKKRSVVVVPSRWYEVFGYSLLESYAQSKPVIAARIGALSEITCHPDLLFEPGDADDLAAKIRVLLESPDKCQEYGFQAKRHVENFFSQQVFYEKLIDIYNELAQSSFPLDKKFD